MKKVTVLTAFVFACLVCPSAYANDFWCVTNPGTFQEQAWYVDFTLTADYTIIPVDGVATFTITMTGVIPPECSNDAHALLFRYSI